MKIPVTVIFCLLFLFMCFSDRCLNGQEEDSNGAQSLFKLLTEWEKEVRQKMKQEPKVQKLLDKYPLAIVTSRFLYDTTGDYAFSAYSFIQKTNDPEIHQGHVQLLFMNSNKPFVLQCNMISGQQNLLVDLGKWNFEKNPSPKQINIGQPQVFSTTCKAKEGHVYLERVRDNRGNDFYVLFQVIELDAKSRYIAFIWRKLPGGKVAKEQ